MCPFSSDNLCTVNVAIPDRTWRMSLRNKVPGEYCISNIHFHWGSNGSVGSEHKLNGNQYGLEAHLVTYKCDEFSSFNDAKSNPFGLAILAFWGEEQTDVQSKDTMMGSMDQLDNRFTTTLKQNEPTAIPVSNLTKLLDLVNPAKYYRYLGSLTTPDCTPNVLWTIFQDPVPLSIKQVLSMFLFI
ncbi:unnamed protein product [Echinostoma caproni]|uniref:Carbonic anhydrase n=1 Tax=Echinostoma caproni TaxID=27848 RepID=A0A183A0W1_9TREM|nr:unnamed protein product [Echinostoma caproni]